MILGSTGMLGQALVKNLLGHGLNVVGVAHSGADFNFDIADKVALKKCFDETKPDLVINAAAIVDLGFCEENPLSAYESNAYAAGIVTEECRAHDAYLVQISTDHYYVGENVLHKEEEPVLLLNEYARTKYIGE